MKRKKSMLSIVGVLVLSLSFVGGASAQCTADVSALCSGKPQPPKKCVVAPCPAPTSIIVEVE